MTTLAIEHVGLTVAELDRSAAFFCDVLGFREQRRSHTDGAAATDITGVPGAQIDHVFLTTDDLELELLTYRSPAPSAPSTTGPEVPGSMHLALRVDDLTDILTHAQAHGWRAAGNPHTMTTGPRAGTVMTYLRDTSGATLELIQPPAAAESR